MHRIITSMQRAEVQRQAPSLPLHLFCTFIICDHTGPETPTFHYQKGQG